MIVLNKNFIITILRGLVNFKIMAKINQGILVRGYSKKDGTKVREHYRGVTYADIKNDPDISEEMKQRVYDEDKLTKVKVGETVKLIGVDYEVESIEEPYIDKTGFFSMTKVNLKNNLRNFVGRKTVFLRDLDINYTGTTEKI